MAIIVGRDADGRRFVANTPDDAATLADLERGEQVGRGGTVSQSGDLNIFVPG